MRGLGSRAFGVYLGPWGFKGASGGYVSEGKSPFSRTPRPVTAISSRPPGVSFSRTEVLSPVSPLGFRVFGV